MRAHRRSFARILGAGRGARRGQGTLLAASRPLGAALGELEVGLPPSAFEQLLGATIISKDPSAKAKAIHSASYGGRYPLLMGRGMGTLEDRFADVLGARRGRALDPPAPSCPEVGHKELAAVRMGIGEEDNYWEVGWYGSDLTMTIFMDRDGQALWKRHHHSFSMAFRPLSHDDPHAHLRIPWERLPEEVQERIASEVALGIHPLLGGTNDRPLNPF